METSTTDLFKQALDLDERDRATLAGLLIESLEEEPDKDLEAAWRAEIKRRVAELESGEAKAVPWEKVKARLLQREND
jgi:putative addiction module component (TIGR02574 family)